MLTAAVRWVIGLAMLAPAVHAPTSIGMPAPLSVQGLRSVETRDDRGNVTRITSIPVQSQFATYGGTKQSCTFTASTGGRASDGQSYVAGQVVRSTRWLFVEGQVVAIGEPTPIATKGGRLADAVRHFVVFCDSTSDAIGVIDVPVSDPVLNPRWAIVQMRNAMQLVTPIVYPNPVVSVGGYVTRYPIWLAVKPNAWTWQISNTARWRGWVLALTASPAALEFVVHFSPDASRPSVAFSATLSCVALDVPPASNSASVPAMPSMPSSASPGAGGPCRYTPPGPGRLTVQARLRYHLTFWASGYREPAADYVLAGPVASYAVGDLSSVNRRP